jgi:hypothetical protein
MVHQNFLRNFAKTQEPHWINENFNFYKSEQGELDVVTIKNEISKYE